MATKYDIEMKRTEEVKKTFVNLLKFDPERFNMRWKMPSDEKIKVLAEDIRNCPEGQKNPVGVFFVKENGKDVPYVVEGFCRWLACKQLYDEAFDTGKELPYIKFRIVKSGTELKQILRSNVAENQKRFELTAMDMVYGMHMLYTKHNMSQAEIAADYNVSQGTVSNYIKLVDLPEQAKESLHNGTLSVSDALLLLKVAPEKRENVLNSVQKDNAVPPSSKLDNPGEKGNTGGGDKPQKNKAIREAAQQNGVKFKRTIRDFVDMVTIQEEDAIKKEDDGETPLVDPIYFLGLNYVCMWFDGTYDTEKFLKKFADTFEVKKMKGK